MLYDSFKYLYPPRPEYKIPAGELAKYDNGKYIAQPKYNGSACMVFTNGSETHIYNRHKQLLHNVSPSIEFAKLAPTSDWYAFAGEYLNKGKLGENGIKERDKYIIWDVIVWKGRHLVGETLEQRLALLEMAYPCNKGMIHVDKIELYQHICCTAFKGIYKAPVYTENFNALYSSIVKTDLYEGLVLKKIDSKLSFSFQEKNNTDWQVKCRKETKLYSF